MSLFVELKRRNVFRVAAAYLALGWVVTQVTATLGPAFNLPPTMLPIVVWIGAIGFPFVIGFAWVYELTPEGLKRESEIDRSQSITTQTGRRLDQLVIVMIAIGIVLVVLDRVVPRAAAPADGAVAGAGLPATGTVASPVPEQSRASALPQGSPDEKSIAVLPFVDMSQARDQEYLSDGIAEELLNLLAKIPELRVIARTSSFAFKGEKTDIAAVAQKLNVAHVLEGSVRKAGNKVRITAQLVRASDSTHLWSETYDRELDDIFAVQDEIAGAVVQQLKLTLLGEAPKSKPVDPKAYALFLQAREFMRRQTAEGFEQGLALSEQALAIEPEYAAAWSMIAEINSRQSALGLVPLEEGIRRAREAVSRALALDPDYPRAQVTLGALAQFDDGDPVTAARHYLRGIALAPSDIDLLTSAGRFALNLNRIDTAVRIGEYATARDPVNSLSHSLLGLAYRYAGRLDEALVATNTSLQLSPGRVSLYYRIAMIKVEQGDPQGALESIQRETEVWKRIGLPAVYYALGRHADSDAALAELIRTDELSASYNIATAYAFRGETDKAFEWLDKAIANKDSGITDIASDPQLAPIRSDPRWLPLLHRLGRAPEQLAAIPFDVKLPAM